MKRLLVLLTALAWLWAAPAFAAIGTPAVLYASPGDGTNTTSYAMTTVTNDCPVGSFLFVGVAIAQGNTSHITAVSDNSSGGPNSYTLVNANTAGGSGIGASGAWTIVTHDVAIGTVITATLQFTDQRRGAIIACDSGISATPADINGAGATGTLPTNVVTFGPTASLAQASELAIGFSTADANVGYTVDAVNGWTTISTFLVYTSQGAIYMAYKITAATTGLTHAPIISGTPDWTDNIYTFKGASSATKTCTLVLLGVGPC